MWMNEWDIDQTLHSTALDELPNYRRGAEVLSKLRDWTNENSDGWPYWMKPSNAAAKLMDLLEPAQYRMTDGDVTERELNRTFTPIKAFLTRQGVDHSIIFGK